MVITELHFPVLGDELTSERREFNFGDSLDQIALTESIKKAQINHGIDEFKLTEKDLEVEEKDFKSLDINGLDDRYFAFDDFVWRR